MKVSPIKGETFIRAPNPKRRIGARCDVLKVGRARSFSGAMEVVTRSKYGKELTILDAFDKLRTR
jgi:hypothetical protein